MISCMRIGKTFYSYSYRDRGPRHISTTVRVQMSRAFLAASAPPPPGSHPDPGPFSRTDAFLSRFSDPSHRCGTETISQNNTTTVSMEVDAPMQEVTNAFEAAGPAEGAATL